MPKNTNNIFDLESTKKRMDSCKFPVLKGQVTGVTDLLIEAKLPGASIGGRVVVKTRSGISIPAEIASLCGLNVKLLPMSPTTGIGPRDAVISRDGGDEILCGRGQLGRIVDTNGVPIDGGGPIEDQELWPLERPAPNPLKRKSVDEQLVTGVRAVDGCLALGLGQRIGLFAGAGLGKSTLLGMLAGRSKCDVSVICLVGERGREVKDFVDNQLGKIGLTKSVVVLATADEPPVIRARAANAATAIAEWWRAKGKNVLLLVDSLTRVVRAKRDVALALGERPARGGFPASAFTPLPPLLERAGRDEVGSITGVYAVLTEGEGNDPVAEEARSLLDGHIVLGKKLAHAGRWPAIDIVQSISRVMDGVVDSKHSQNATSFRKLIGAYEENEDLILMGAYRPGTSPETDLAMERKKEIEAFLRQEKDDFSPIEETLAALNKITRHAPNQV